VLEPQRMGEIFPFSCWDIYTPELRGVVDALKGEIPLSFLSGDHIHLICEESKIKTGWLEETLRGICPPEAKWEEVQPTVQDLYFVLEGGDGP